MFAHQSSDNDSGFTALRRHDEYYLTGGDLFFLVEQNHFRVHRYFFERESQFFKIQLATPASPGAARRGTSESTAIVLNDVKSADFAKFLWVFYNPKYSLYKARVDDWVVIMALAHQWGFQEVMRLATREIERLEMPDIDRIVAYHRFELDRSLLIHRYAALTAREEPLTYEEGMALGMDTTLKIFRAREVARATPAADGSRSPTSAVLPDEEMQSLIVDLFDITEYSTSEGDKESQVPKQPESVKSSPTKQTSSTTKPASSISNEPPVPPAKTNGTSSTPTPATPVKPATAPGASKPAWGAGASTTKAGGAATDANATPTTTTTTSTENPTTSTTKPVPDTTTAANDTNKDAGNEQKGASTAGATNASSGPNMPDRLSSLFSEPSTGTAGDVDTSGAATGNGVSDPNASDPNKSPEGLRSPTPSGNKKKWKKTN